MVIPIIVIIATVIISTYKSLGFYFWHDDFAVFYGAKLGICILGWPYNTFCSLFNSLYGILGYKPILYFLLGQLLLVFASLSLYLFLNQLFAKKASLILTLLFSTGYIGAGIMLEAYDPFISYPSIGFLLLSLYYLDKYSQKKLINNLIFSFILFAMSVMWFYARSGTYLIPIVGYIVLLSKWNTKKKIVLSTVFLLIFILFFSVIPLGFSKGSTSSVSLITYILKADLISKLGLFLQTFGGLLVPYFINTTDRAVYYLGTVIVSLYFYSLAKSRKDKTVFNLRLFSGLWMIALYLPYGLRSDWRLEPTHRYIMYVFPGILIYWGTLLNSKLTKTIGGGLFLLFLLSQNLYLGNHLDSSRKQGEFLKSLKKFQPILSTPALVYVDFKPSIKVIASDYFRVGDLPSEAVLGTEYGVRYENLKLVTDYSVFARELKNYNSDQIYTFYYDGEKVIDTTTDSRQHSDRIIKDVNVILQTKLIEDKNTKLWTGSTENIVFPEMGNNPSIPYVLNIYYSASPIDFPIPYSQGCINCGTWSDKDIIDSLKYLENQNLIVKGINARSSESGEDTDPTALVDGDINTYWMANRQKWFEKQYPKITLNFATAREMRGIDIYSSNSARVLTNLKISLNNKAIDVDAETNKELLKVRWQNQSIGIIELTLIDTKAGDNPVINEIIPVGLEKPNIVSDKMFSAPASIIRTEETKKAFRQFVKSGGNICLNWDAEGYGKGSVISKIIADGNIQKMRFEIPTTGSVKPKFSLGCVNYPIIINVTKIEVDPYIKD